MSCKCVFRGYPCKGAERTGGTIYRTSCGNTVYGLELVKQYFCVYCGEIIAADKIVDPLNRNFSKK